jgi:hypothetical protein
MESAPMNTSRSPQVKRITVSPELGQKLEQAARELPHYENREFYSLDLQRSVHERLRASCPDGFDSLIDQVKGLLTRRPHCVIVNGLNYDPGNRLIVAINRAFGKLVARPYEAPRAQLVHYIQPATDLPASRGGLYESEKLHTDTADWDHPVDLISMLCVRADRGGGGRSRILDVEALRGLVRRRLGKTAVDLLESEPVPWQIADYHGGGISWRTVLTESGVCWRRYTIDLALDSLGRALSADMSRTLDDLEEVIEDASDTLEFSICDGELMFLDNHRAIHARTPIRQPGRSDRLMIRSWIQSTKIEDDGTQHCPPGSPDPY